MKLQPEQTEALEPRTLEEQRSAFQRALNVVTREYLTELDKYPIVRPETSLIDRDVGQYCRFFQVKQIVYSRKEDFLQKATTVLYTAYALNVSIDVLIRSDGTETNYYLGVSSDRQNLCDCAEAVSQSFCGNFMGSDLTLLSNDDARDLMQISFPVHDTANVAAVSGIPALRGEDKHSVENFVQGIENLTDALQNRRYTLLIKADPIQHDTLREMRRAYERIDTDLSAYEKTTFTFSATDTITTTYSDGTSDSQTTGTSVTDSVSTAHSDSYSLSDGTNESTSKNNGALLGVAAGVAAAGIIVATGGAAAIPLVTAATVIGGASGAGAAIGGALIGTKTTGSSHQETTGTSDSQTNSIANSESNSSTYSVTCTKSDGDSHADGRTRQFTMENKRISSVRRQIDENLKRLDTCESYGTFEAAAYVTADSYADTQSVAALYNALMRGEKSALQTTQINSWRGVTGGVAVQYLQKLAQPQFLYQMGETTTAVSPAIPVSGQELALQIGLPKHSFSGVAVIEHAAFGCNPPHTDKALNLGCVFRMGKAEESRRIELSVPSLASHTFITGSTGSGKSNTIYTMLSALSKQHVHFMVIEPAKGEYKQIFGGNPDVHVYSTNPKLAELLRMNPFTFPNSIHVLEHVDRLVEIFNACWPMYAAMPAILKDAVQTCYERKGWNLDLSECEEKRYPTMADLVEILPEVVQKSAYSADTQSDYVGALVTRVRSLSNGINGRIFCSGREIPAEELFDTDTIVDLSRVGSSETKSLLMGILVMKLQEHRMDRGEMNAALSHVTVLEEAHNLLRRIPQEQSQESSNLQGKSVEMIGNAIAEMRTYGEGFIIADQAPGLMDMAVIRNTNTKIIMRLPDEEDRKLVGHAAGLNDEQIKELAKLECGVAAVYQNDWLEPVLCRVAHFTAANPYKYRPQEIAITDELKTRLYLALLGKADLRELPQEDVDVLSNWVEILPVGQYTREHLLEMLSGSPLKPQIRDALIYNLLDGSTIAESLLNTTDPEKTEAEITCSLQIACGQLDKESTQAVLLAIGRTAQQEQIENGIAGVDYSKVFPFERADGLI